MAQDEMEDATLFQAEDEQLSARQLSREGDAYEIPGVTLETLIGAGTFGEVWAGVQGRTGQRVAVKIFTRRLGLDWDYFCKEVERLREVSEHPNIVTLLDADLEHDPAYLVMPHLTGGSLAEQASKEGGRALPDQVVQWFYQISEALHFIHQKGLLHCDLKPVNVLLDGEGRARLVDFGQALVAGAGQTSLGTVGYMAPEQVAAALGETDQIPNPRWDVYSLGATAYNLLTGQLPRIPLASRNQLSALTDAGERLKVYGQTLNRAPLVRISELNRAVDPELCSLIEGCLATDPDKRPRTAGEVVDDLGRWRQDQPLLVKRPWTRSYVASRFLKRNRSSVLLSSVFLALLLGFNWVMDQRISSLVADKEPVAEVESEQLGQDFQPPPIAKVEPPKVELSDDGSGRLVEFLQAAAVESQRPAEKRMGLPDMAFPLLWQARLPEHILSLTHSPGEHWLGVRTGDGRAYLLESSSGRSRELAGLSCVDFGSKRLALGYRDGRVEIRDGSLKLLRKVGTHKALVTSVQLSSKGVVSSSLDGTVRDWTSKPKVYPAPVLAAATSPTGRLAVATADRILRANGRKVKLPGNLFELEFGESLTGVLLNGRGVEVQGDQAVMRSEREDADFKIQDRFILANSTEPPTPIPQVERPRSLLATKSHLYLLTGRVIRCYGLSAIERGRLDRDLPGDLVLIKAQLECGGRLNESNQVELFSVSEWSGRARAYHQLRADHKLRCRYPASW